MGIRFEKNGAENGKTAFLVHRRLVGSWTAVASILWDGRDWTLNALANGRIDRFASLADAKDEARKL